MGCSLSKGSDGTKEMSLQTMENTGAPAQVSWDCTSNSWKGVSSQSSSKSSHSGSKNEDEEELFVDNMVKTNELREAQDILEPGQPPNKVEQKGVSDSDSSVTAVTQMNNMVMQMQTTESDAPPCRPGHQNLLEGFLEDRSKLCEKENLPVRLDPLPPQMCGYCSPRQGFIPVDVKYVDDCSRYSSPKHCTDSEQFSTASGQEDLWHSIQSAYRIDRANSGSSTSKTGVQQAFELILDENGLRVLETKLPAVPKQTVACIGHWGNETVAAMPNFSANCIDLEISTSSNELEGPNLSSGDGSQSPQHDRREDPQSPMDDISVEDLEMLEAELQASMSSFKTH